MMTAGRRQWIIEKLVMDNFNESLLCTLSLETVCFNGNTMITHGDIVDHHGKRQDAKSDK